MTKGSGSSEENDQQNENQNNQSEKMSEEQLLKIVQDQAKQMADLQNQMKEMAENQTNNVAFSVEAMKNMSEYFKRAGSVGPTGRPIAEKPDAKDWDPVGVRFASPFVGYLVADDMRNGEYFPLPFGKEFIYFDYAATRKVQQGKYMATAPFSIYHCKSKKEIEYLKAHSLFNVQFFASVNANMLGDEHIKLQKLNRIMQVLRNYELPQLWQAAREHELDIIEDNVILRNNLAQKMLQKEMEMELAPQMKSMADVLQEKKIADNVKAKA